MTSVKQNGPLPVEVIFNPAWWYHNCGIEFGRDFFFNPALRVESELKMRNYLYERYGDLGLGDKENIKRPVIGPVHLAAGFMMSELFGCDVIFHKDAPPDVICRNLNVDEVLKLKAPSFQNSVPMNGLIELMNELESKFGYLEGDINWSGIQNIALDVRGSDLFIDYYENPDIVRNLFDVISSTLINVVQYMRRRTGTSSLSVNPSVGKFSSSINLHSNCSVTMISPKIYEEHLLVFENHLSACLQPYGIHHCGSNMQYFAEEYGKVNDVCFFDVGWGSDVAICRQHLPYVFFNLRLSPVKLLSCSENEVEEDVIRLVTMNGGIMNAGLCCINLDVGTPDDNIQRIFKTAEMIKELFRNSFSD